MDKISFAVYGPPQGKARPRVVRMKNGRSMSYTPDKTVAYEELVRKKYLETAGRPLLWEGPVSVQIIAEHPIPKSVSRKKQRSCSTETCALQKNRIGTTSGKSYAIPSTGLLTKTMRRLYGLS